MSLRTNYGVNTDPNEKKDPAKIKHVIAEILGKVGGSIVFCNKARKFIE